MPYSAIQTELQDVLVLEPKILGENRGFFDSFDQRDFEEATRVKVGSFMIFEFRINFLEFL